MTRADRHYQERALSEGMAVAVVREAGDRTRGCKCRRVVEVVVPETERFKARAGPLGGALSGASSAAAFEDTRELRVCTCNIGPGWRGTAAPLYRDNPFSLPDHALAQPGLRRQSPASYVHASCP